ncbi:MULTISPECIES: Gfo/Idh/MocA family protein [unclassified Paenibacillus]|uniref:Gfo/Idh/MocA family protein n=1 Tax=unclassified Paenibacillus TaxID=185978 RepID=UPI001C128031|nr:MULTISPECIES: Gfo/Idh/MocA family oxidoreductase [unclassified Paenibacillus]MBU5445302.1 Gfo/Idh/MocA family oxidoreductase [Paenibacillus sp. MSJ-34]CAH0122803.1 Inositol 2-dehydrogenase/D-chiro-inositol 3-dehydrogenase [Paenibacillus sp. CECT 9249]
MIKVALLSFWHVHAADYAKQAEQHPDTQIVAVWDELPGRGREEAAKRGVPFYESLDELLSEPGIDAVIVDAPTDMHRDVMVKAAAAGKHIFTEKVVAPTLRETNEIVNAAAENGVVLTVSLPRLNDGYTLAIQDILQQGLLGDITFARVRLSHNGAVAGWLPDHFYNLRQCGGGALIDLGCHPMYLTRLFLGLPERVSAHYGYVTGKEVEDNATAVLQYGNGALGIVEAGFVNSHSPFAIEIHGTEGTLLFGTPEPKLLVRSNKQTDSEGDWTEYPLHAARLSAFEQWVNHIREGSSADDNIRLAVDLTRLMEASNLSVRLQRPIRLDELAE